MRPDSARVHLPHGVVAIYEVGSGPSIVLLHGMGSSHRSWHRVARDLATERRVVVPDLPGFGGSDPVGAGFQPAAVADVIAAALKERGVEPFDLVGHSLGGLVAVVLADRHPALVRCLILVAPAGLQPRLALPGLAIGRMLEALIGVRRELGGPVAASAQARRLMFGAWSTIRSGCTPSTRESCSRPRGVRPASARASRPRSTRTSARRWHASRCPSPSCGVWRTGCSRWPAPPRRGRPGLARRCI